MRVEGPAVFEERAADREHFRLCLPRGQNVLEFLPARSFASARLFMRGPLLAGTEGRAAAIRDRLAPDFLDEGRPLVAPRQVHGVRILKADPEAALPAHVEADGVLLTRSDLDASLRFADCAPVLLLPSEECARRHGPWALILHSGYKGTVQNIARSGLLGVERSMGRGATASASAWIGPCIAGRSYPRTLEEWTQRGLSTFHPDNVERVGQSFYFDIAGEIRRQLAECGVPEERIHVAGMDTASDGRCYSYRGGDREDRMFLHLRLL